MKAKSEAQAYSDSHGWKKVGDKGAAGLYSNGTLFVMCNGTEWFASKTPDASGRWAKGWANILPAMRFADAHSKAQAKCDGRQRKVTIRLDERADAEAMEAEEIMDDLGEMHDIELDARNALPGWEYDEEHVILENTAGRYIVGKIYDNCVSIGSGHVREFETPVEAVKALQKGFEIKNVGPLGDQERAKRSEALSKAQAKYDDRQRKVTIRLDEQGDADLIARIEAQPSMTAYIKELVRRDMER